VSASASVVARCSQSLFCELVATLRAHVWLIAPAEIYIIAVYGTALLLGRPGSFSFLGYERAFSIATPILCGGFLVGRAMYLMLIMRPRRLVHAIIDDLWTNYLTRHRLLQAVPVVIVLPLFNSACTLAKTLIPALHPYDWDATLARWDTVLHFGIAPWRALAPVLATPFMTSVANIIYCGWFFGLASLWFWQAFALRDRLLRMQFFIGYMACFILLGNIMATILASGGPCYYGRLVDGPDPYAPLMLYLGRVDLPGYLNISVGLQNTLWNYYASGDSGVGAGISAMPSMHVAGATLFALLGWRTNRFLAVALSINVGLILIATVFLGWHYAVDGYISIIGSVAIWWIVGRILRWVVAPVEHNGHPTGGDRATPCANLDRAT
jgi:hypothetical protein